MVAGHPGLLYSRGVGLVVVMPAFRAAATLPAALSALRATGLALDVVVVDDGCPMGSGDVADAWARDAGWPVRVVRNGRNLGTSAARNVGWRATHGDLVAFVDADVEVAPDALPRLRDVLESDATLLGANGTLAGCGAIDLVSAFVNTSLRFQLASHGPRVNSAFTSLCVMRRATLERMGGWDERRSSRYGDDVATRWHLSPGSIAQVAGAVGAHRKTVALGGMLRHRVNVGVHFVRALRENDRVVARHPHLAVLAVRYPQNTLLSALSVPVALVERLEASAVVTPLGAVALAWVVGNFGFLRFVAREDGFRRAAVALPLTVLEGHALLVGVTLGFIHLIRRPRGDT